MAQQSGGINQSGQVLQWFGQGSYFEQHKLIASSILMGAVLLAFLATQQLNKEQATVVSYEENSDAFLLAADLPPEAFADKGLIHGSSQNEINTLSIVWFCFIALLRMQMIVMFLGHS